MLVRAPEFFPAFLLEELDCTVWAVEPNEEMRRKAEEELRDISRLSFVKGTAEATGLHSQSVSFVTAAQAFHLVFSQSFPSGMLAHSASKWYGGASVESPCGGD